VGSVPVRLAVLLDVGRDFDPKPRGATVVGTYASDALADRRRFALPVAESGPGARVRALIPGA
jgi:hypothetical protein